MLFACTYALEEGWCPQTYFVWFIGPTSAVVPVEDEYMTMLDNSTIQIEWMIRDPGAYEIYVWPEYEHCEHYNWMKFPLSKCMVYGTPFQIDVVGPPPIDSMTPCTGVMKKEEADGRWISTKHIAPRYLSEAWARTYFQGAAEEIPEYIWQPYTCKRSRPVMATALDDPKYSHINHVLYIGDSTTRSPYCGLIYPALHDGVTDGVCEFRGDAWGYQSWPFRVFDYLTAANRETRWSYIYMGGKVSSYDEAYLQMSTIASEPHPVSHIVANIGLWLQQTHNETEYAEEVRQLLETVRDYWPEAYVIWKTTTSIVHPIKCNDGKLVRPNTRVQRRVSMDVVEEFRELGMRIDVVDANTLTDGRPDATNDARHWVVERNGEGLRGFHTDRATIRRLGEAEMGVQEWIWDLWRLEGQ
ncbi:hypothetical protein YB2330_005999 [Saitoella coloradoensis]